MLDSKEINIHQEDQLGAALNPENGLSNKGEAIGNRSHNFYGVIIN
jgi:hypothetical protein